MRVLIRADAGAQIGSGHVMRCLTLAGALEEKGADVSFLCADDPVARDLFSRHRPQAQVFWRGMPEGSYDWLVVDHYGLDARWEREARKTAAKIAVIDDLADRFHDCDLLIDQNLYPEGENPYLSLCRRPCEYLIGPRFALLRKGFAKPSSAVRKRRLCVFLGGTDPNGDTLKVGRALAAAQIEDWRIDILAQAGIPGRDEIERLCALRGWTLNKGITDMPAWLAGAGAVLCSGGGFTWERCAAGVPALTMSIAENQTRGLKELETRGASLYLGESANLSGEEITRAIEEFLREGELRERLAGAARSLADGNGASRVAQEMFTLAGEISLRAAQEQDSENVWRWRNDIEVRRNAKSQDEIPFDKHRQWYAEILDSPHHDLLIASSPAGTLGVVRLDYEGDCALLSVHLVSERMGQGLGTALLIAAERWIFEKRPAINFIEAEIMPHNERSRKVFRRAGYCYKEGIRYLHAIKREEEGP